MNSEINPNNMHELNLEDMEAVVGGKTFKSTTTTFELTTETGATSASEYDVTVKAIAANAADNSQAAR